MPQNQQPEWISAKEAAARCGVSLGTLYRIINEGRLPAYKVGRSIQLQAPDVEAFLERCRIEPGALDHLVRHTAKRA